MSRKEERLRNEALDFALEIAKARGVEGLEEEVRNRGAYGASQLNLTNAQMERATEQVREHSAIVAVAMAINVLQEHFNFNTLQIEEFKEKYADIIHICMGDKALIEKMIEESNWTWRDE